MAKVYAAADIGSNTAHLLVAETDGTKTSRLENESEWLGLGEVVAREGLIPPAQEAALVRVLTRFLRIASGRRAERMYTFATEAVRRASNHNDFLRKVRQHCGIEVDVISGRREAELALRGALIDTGVSFPAVLFDIGGGSAQIARYDGVSITHEASLPIGTGTLMAMWTKGTVPSDDEEVKVKQIIDNAVRECDGFGDVVFGIGSGGVARGMIRALHADGERVLHVFELEYLERVLQRIDASTAMLRFGIGGKRAACMLPGVWVMRALMQRFGLTEITVSECSIRDGAILAMASGEIEGMKV